MARLSVSQIRSKMREAERKQKRAIDKYNQDVRKHNQKVKKAVSDYNREQKPQLKSSSKSSAN